MLFLVLVRLVLASSRVLVNTKSSLAVNTNALMNASTATSELVSFLAFSPLVFKSLRISHFPNVPGVRESAKLKISGSTGKYTCAPNHYLALQGGVVAHENLGTQDTITVGCDACGQPAAIECHPANAPTRFEGGKL